MDNYDLIKIKEEIRKKKNKQNFKIPKAVNKFLLLIVITLMNMILIKQSNKYKTMFYNNVYEKNISFASINNTYKKIQMHFEDVCV